MNIVIRTERVRRAVRRLGENSYLPAYYVSCSWSERESVSFGGNYSYLKYNARCRRTACIKFTIPQRYFTNSYRTTILILRVPMQEGICRAVWRSRRTLHISSRTSPASWYHSAPYGWPRGRPRSRCRSGGTGPKCWAPSRLFSSSGWSPACCCTWPSSASQTWRTPSTPTLC